MKNILTAFIIFFSAHFVSAITFGGPGTDHGYALAKNSDNGYVLLGVYDSTSSDIFVIKVDSTGHILWEKIIVVPGNDYSAGIVQTDDDGFVIIGTGTDNAGALRAWLLRLNSIGDTLWTKMYHDPSSVLETGGYVEIYSPDQYTIGINSNSLAGTNFHYLYRTDTLGNLTDTLNTSPENAMVLPVLNGYLMTSTISGFTPPAINLNRYDSVGGLTFDKSFFDQNLVKGMTGFSSAICGSGFLTVGNTDLFSSPGVVEYLIMKTDSTGDSLWTRHWGSGTNTLNNIISTNNSQFYVVGNNNNAGYRRDFIWKTDTIGDTIWTKYVSDHVQIFSIIPDLNGGFALIGDTVDTISGNTDVWFMAYDSSGNPILNPILSLSNNMVVGSGINIFPNPSKDKLNIDFGKNYSDLTGGTIELHDSSGKFLFRKKITRQNEFIEQQQKGVYFIYFMDKNNRKVDVKKFIKD